MKAAYASALALAAVLVSGPAAAEHPGAASVDHLVKVYSGEQAKSRDQVRAELAAAQQVRDVRPSDQFGRTASEVNSAGRAAISVADGKARQDVRAEAADRSIRMSDQFGRTVAEAYPSFEAPASTRSASAAARNGQGA